MKKCVSLLLALMLALVGCSAEEPAPATQPTTVPPTQPAETTVPTQPPKTRADIQLVILLPDQETLHWEQTGTQLQEMLGDYFYDTQLLYAHSNPGEQAQQLLQAVEAGVDGIILAPVDSTALLEGCAQAEAAGIPIFCYDRLLMDTEAASYYISFDYYGIGVALGQQIVTQKGLDALEEGAVVTIEFFMGSPEDHSAVLLYEGILSQLQPYLEKGALVTRSGRTALEDTCVVDWDAAAAAENLRAYMKEYYKGQAPDVVCTVSDDFAAACIAALEEKKLQQLPLITGVGGSDEARQMVADGKLAFTAAMDRTVLNDRLATTVDGVISGKEPEVNDTENCHNNVKTVPAYLCDFELVTP